MWKTNSSALRYTLFYKDHFYKNVEADIYPPNLRNVWAKIRTSSGSAKLYAFLWKRKVYCSTDLWQTSARSLFKLAVGCVPRSCMDRKAAAIRRLYAWSDLVELRTCFTLWGRLARQPRAWLKRLKTMGSVRWFVSKHQFSCFASVNCSSVLVIMVEQASKKQRWRSF